MKLLNFTNMLPQNWINMKIEGVFEKFLRISETKSAFLGQKTTILLW